uniref:DAZ-associated protein 2 n=1 Tax=Callorhinchus milii TaxID=7868 RepID=V9L732_CALMI
MNNKAPYHVAETSQSAPQDLTVKCCDCVFCGRDKIYGPYSQQPCYPTQQATVAPPHYPTVQVPQPPAYAEAPPSYAELYDPRYVHAPANVGAGFPGGMYVPVTAQMPMGPVGAGMPMTYYAVPQLFPQSSTVLMERGFDPGARFGAGASASIPPPPPGCPPNAAQIAAMQGANVVVTQRKGTWFLGGSDGGYSVW